MINFDEFKEGCPCRKKSPHISCLYKCSATQSSHGEEKHCSEKNCVIVYVMYLYSKIKENKEGE